MAGIDINLDTAEDYPTIKFSVYEKSSIAVSERPRGEVTIQLIKTINKITTELIEFEKPYDAELPLEKAGRMKTVDGKVFDSLPFELILLTKFMIVWIP